MFVTVFYKRSRVCPQCNTVVHAMDGVLLLGSLRNAMKRKKALLSEEELLVRDKVNKASKRASETREQTLHMQARTELNADDKHKHLSYT